MKGRIILDKNVEYSKEEREKIYKEIRKIDLYRTDFFGELVSKLNNPIGNLLSGTLNITYAKTINDDSIRDNINEIVDGVFTIAVNNPGNYRSNGSTTKLDMPELNNDPTQAIFLYRPTTSKTYAIILTQK